MPKTHPKHTKKPSLSLPKRIPNPYYNRILLGLCLTFPLIFFAELMQGTILYDISGLLAIAGTIIMLLNFIMGLIKGKKS